MTEAVVTSSVLILVVIVLRYAMRGKISLRLQYALWAVVVIRLLLPLNLLPSSVSIMNPLDTAWAAFNVQPDALPVYGDTGESAAPLASGATQAGATEAEAPNIELTDVAASGLPDQAASRSMPVSEVLAAVWFGGAGITVIWMAAANMLLRYKLKKFSRPIDYSGSRLPVYQTPGLPSPCLFGIIKPKIYLTPGSYSTEQELRIIVIHEETHYAHLDHLWVYLRCLCLALYWFNPLVWMAATLSRRDCELACDEGTLRQIGEENRTQYGRMLVSMMTATKSPSVLLSGATMMTSGISGIKERIRLIAVKPKMLLSTLIIVIVVVCAAVGCTFTGAKPGTSAEHEVSTQPGVDASSAAETADFAPVVSASVSEDFATVVGNGKTAEEFAHNYIDYVARHFQEGEPQDKKVSIVEAKLTNLECIASFKAMGNGVELWQIEYRLKPDNIDNVILDGSVTIEDGWITETGSYGKPCLIVTYMNDVPTYIGITNTFTIGEEGGTENMLNQFIANNWPLPGATHSSPPEPREWDDTDLDECITEAIISNNMGHFISGSNPEFATEAHTILKTVEEGSTTMVYMVACYAQYEFPNGKPQSTGMYNAPAALTFEKDSGSAYTLIEYWSPAWGTPTQQQISEKFPSDIAKKAYGLDADLWDVCKQKATEYATTRNGQ